MVRLPRLPSLFRIDNSRRKTFRMGEHVQTPILNRSLGGTVPTVLLPSRANVETAEAGYSFLTRGPELQSNGVGPTALRFRPVKAALTRSNAPSSQFQRSFPSRSLFPVSFSSRSFPFCCFRPIGSFPFSIFLSSPRLPLLPFVLFGPRWAHATHGSLLAASPAFLCVRFR